MFLASGSAVVIPCLSGFVRDPNGAPVVGGDLDFILPATGVKLITPGDNTDASGFYSVCVLPGIYNVTYAPPPGTRLMGKVMPNVDLTANIGKELDVTLAFGTVVSGMVTDTLGTPIGDVDVDVDQVTGGRVFTPDDDSNPATGAYRVVVPDGLYRMRFEPPLGSRWRGVQFDSVSVAGDAVLDAELLQGLILNGRVQDTGGAPIFDIEVDLRDHSTGAKVFVANNSTDASGDYAVAVPAGTFQLRFSPPRGSRFVAETIDGFVMASDRKWDEQLESGHLVSFVVTDTSGNPVPGVDVDVKVTSTGDKLFTPNDNTDAQGTAEVAVLPGTYTLQFDPPVGTTFDRVVLPQVFVQRDTTITVQLPEVRRVMATGRVTDGQGVGLAGVTFDAQLQPGGEEVFISVDESDAMGLFNLSIPIGSYHVFVSPVRGTRFVGRKIENVIVSNDTTWGDIILNAGSLVDVMVQTDTGGAIAGADLDFIDTTTGTEVFTPFDNTDESGSAMVAVASGIYTVVVTPPTQSGFDILQVSNFTVNGDTTATLTLASASQGSPPPFELSQNFPNPFNAGTTIAYRLTRPTDISISIYNVKGQLIKVLETGPRTPDVFTTVWDGTDGSGNRVATGIYFYRLRTSVGNETRKMVLLR